MLKRLPLWITFPVAGIAIFLAVLSGTITAETYLSTPQARKDFHFGAQIFTGNWSLPSYLDEDGSWKPTDRQIHWRLALSISIGVVLNFLALGLISVLFQRLRDLKGISAMRLLDRDRGVDSSIATSVFKLLEETGRFTDEELQRLNPKIDEAIADGRSSWLEEELPTLVGADNARALKRTLATLNVGPG